MIELHYTVTHRIKIFEKDVIPVLNISEIVKKTDEMFGLFNKHFYHSRSMNHVTLRRLQGTF